MNLSHKRSSSQLPVSVRGAAAFTLAEMMTTLAVFSLVVIAMVSLEIFGFKMNSLTSNKLKSTTDSVNALGQIRTTILGATGPVIIGNYNITNSTFTAVANGQTAVGNALQFPNSASNTVTFYLNSTTKKLYELGITTNNQPFKLSVSSSIVNSQPFQALDCFGSSVTVGSTTHYTIKTTLLFSNLVYAVPTAIYDTYRVEASTTPRQQYNN